MTDTREKIEDYLSDLITPPRGECAQDEARKIVDRILALPRSEQAGEAQPVAWVSLGGLKRLQGQLGAYIYGSPGEYASTALYTHPAPAAAPATLTDEQCDAMLSAFFVHQLPDGEDRRCPMRKAMRRAWAAAPLDVRPADDARVKRLDWQPIRTAPTDGTRVLIWDGEDDEVVIALWKDCEGVFDGFVSDQGGHGLASATHWMSLPQPPAIDAARGAGDREAQI